MPAVFAIQWLARRKGDLGASEPSRLGIRRSHSQSESGGTVKAYCQVTSAKWSWSDAVPWRVKQFSRISWHSNSFNRYALIPLTMQKVLCEKTHSQKFIFLQGCRSFERTWAFKKQVGKLRVTARWIFTRVVHRMARHYWHLYLQATVLASPPFPCFPWSTPWGKFNKSAKCSRCTCCNCSIFNSCTNQKQGQREKMANVRTMDLEMKDGKD